MRRIFFTLCSVLILAACSSPKYAYYFDRHDYNSGKKNNHEESLSQATDQQSFTIDNATLVASADEKAFTPAAQPEKTKIAIASVVEKYKSMSKTERKEFRKELKKELKTLIKEKKNSVDSTHGTKAMDHDLKLAAIFGAVGLVLTLLGGVDSVFWVLGVISLVIGVVFFVKWLVRQ